MRPLKGKPGCKRCQKRQRQVLRGGMVSSGSAALMKVTRAWSLRQYCPDTFLSVNHVDSGCMLHMAGGSGAQELAAQPPQKRPHVLLSHLGDEEEEGDAGAL